MYSFGSCTPPRAARSRCIVAELGAVVRVPGLSADGSNQGVADRTATCDLSGVSAADRREWYAVSVGNEASISFGTPLRLRGGGRMRDLVYRDGEYVDCVSFQFTLPRAEGEPPTSLAAGPERAGMPEV